MITGPHIIAGQQVFVIVNWGDVPLNQETDEGGGLEEENLLSLERLDTISVLVMEDMRTGRVGECPDVYQKAKK